MNDNDQSSAAALRPHRPEGDLSPASPAEKRTFPWGRLKALFPARQSLRDDLAVALEAPQAHSEDSFSASERIILQNVLKLGDMRVEDVMVPRADIEAIEIDTTIGHAVMRFREVGHSRLPVFEDTLDNVLGMIHIKDVLDAITGPAKPDSSASTGAANGAGSPVRMLSAALRQKVGKRDIMRKVLFVPPSMPVTDLLASMQASRVHMAMVVDEYGGIDGLVTIEDLLEAVVGDIEDEHDEDEGVLVRASGEDVYLADARAELDEVIAVIGPDFDPGELTEDVDTLGGLIFALAGRVPVRGEVISKLKDFEFEIVRADPRRVKHVRITRRRRKEPLLLAAPLPEEATSQTESSATP